MSTQLSLHPKRIRRVEIKRSGIIITMRALLVMSRRCPSFRYPSHWERTRRAIGKHIAATPAKHPKDLAIVPPHFVFESQINPAEDEDLNSRLRQTLEAAREWAIQVDTYSCIRTIPQTPSATDCADCIAHAIDRMGLPRFPSSPLLGLSFERRNIDRVKAGPWLEDELYARWTALYGLCYDDTPPFVICVVTCPVDSFPKTDDEQFLPAEICTLLGMLVTPVGAEVERAAIITVDQDLRARTTTAQYVPPSEGQEPSSPPTVRFRASPVVDIGTPRLQDDDYWTKPEHEDWREKLFQLLYAAATVCTPPPPPPPEEPKTECPDDDDDNNDGGHQGVSCDTASDSSDGSPSSGPAASDEERSGELLGTSLQSAHTQYSKDGDDDTKPKS